MGIFLGLSGAFCFAAAAICFKFGQRSHPGDNGLFLSVLVNTVLLGVIAAFADWPQWDTAGVVGLMAGGIVGTVGGRSSLLKGIRAIGPSRSNAFLAGNPVVAAIAGWFVLSERLSTRELFGGALVVVGLVWLVRARSAVRPGTEKPPLVGYLWAIAAPVFFGSAFVIRKWALGLFPGSVIGAFIGSAAAMLFITYSEGRRTSTGELVKRNLGHPPLWYVAAGVATTLALLAQFTAFSFLPAWVVGILQGTQGIWTLGLGWLFMREEEHIDARLVGAVMLVAAGVVLIGLEV